MGVSTLDIHVCFDMGVSALDTHVKVQVYTHVIACYTHVTYFCGKHPCHFH